MRTGTARILPASANPLVPSAPEVNPTLELHLHPALQRKIGDVQWTTNHSSTQNMVLMTITYQRLLKSHPRFTCLQIMHGGALHRGGLRTAKYSAPSNVFPHEGIEAWVSGALSNDYERRGYVNIDMGSGDFKNTAHVFCW